MIIANYYNREKHRFRRKCNLFFSRKISFISFKRKKMKHKSIKQKITHFTNAKASIKKDSDEIDPFRVEFSDKLEKSLTNFPKFDFFLIFLKIIFIFSQNYFYFFSKLKLIFRQKNQQTLSVAKYSNLDDDNIFNYNAYFKKRYFKFKFFSLM